MEGQDVTEDPISTWDPDESVTRGFLFADLRGYTSFVEARGASAASDLLDAYRNLVRNAVARFHGAEIRTEGDGFYVVFPSVSQAVRCALSILEAALAESARRPDRPVRVGIGIHAGETLETSEGFVGGAVNIAARLCSLATAGELLVSETVRSLTRTVLAVDFVPRGSRRLKGVPERITVFAATPLGARAMRPTTGGRSIAMGAITRLTGIASLVIVTTLVGVVVAAQLFLRGAAPAPSPSGGATMPSSPPAAAASATASPSGGGLPSPGRSPTAAPSGDRTAPPSVGLGSYPNPAERRLIAALPSSVRGDCHRGAYPDLYTGPDTERNRVPSASAVCSVDGGRVVSVAAMWFERFDRAAEELLFKTIGARKIPAGDCATLVPATGAWGIDGNRMGQVACYVTAGHAHVDWTYAADRVVVMAEGASDDPTRLIRWWRAASISVGQPASGTTRSGVASTATPGGPSPGPRVAPKNGIIAYASGAGGRATLLTIDPLAGASRTLTSSPGADARPVWTADGRSLAFERHNGTRDDPARIGVVKPGSQARVLPVDTDGVAAELWQSDGAPVWSLDGRTIVMERAFAQPASGGTASEIYLTRPDGSGQHRLTENSIGAGDPGFPDRNIDPTFTPDGRIGYVHAGFGGSCGVVLETDLEAVDERFVADYSCATGADFEHGVSPSDPQWSPDGRSLVFVEHSRQQGTFINTVIDGARPRRIVTDNTVAGPPGMAGPARWSPDGRWLLFGVQGLGIYVVAPDGTGLRALVGGDAGAAVDGQPVWSPDGTAVAYTALVDAQTELFIVGVESEAITRLTRTAESEAEPAWQPLFP